MRTCAAVLMETALVPPVADARVTPGHRFQIEFGLSLARVVTAVAAVVVVVVATTASP